MKYNTFIKSSKITKYPFQSIASIKSDFFTCYFKNNIDLIANFKSFTKSSADEIQIDKGNLFAEMLKNVQSNCCQKKRKY